jgi:hypothetical protein
VPLDQWQKRFEAIFLRSPEESLSVFSVVSMRYATMLEESAIV